MNRLWGLARQWVQFLVKDAKLVIGHIDMDFRQFSRANPQGNASSMTDEEEAMLSLLSHLN